MSGFDRRQSLRIIVGVVIFFGAALPCAAEISKNLLTNGSFDGAVGSKGLPAGWSLYGGNGKDQEIKVVDLPGDGGKAALLVDGDRAAEIGLRQDIPAKPGLTYEAAVDVRAAKGASTSGAHLQLRFLPSNQFTQTDLSARSDKTFNRVSTKATAPRGTKRVMVYLYTHSTPTPKVVLRNASLVSGVTPPPPPPPKPVPPTYTKLKKLHLATTLVAGGKPCITIIAPASGVYRQQAQRIRQAIRKLTGVEVIVADDASPAAAVPIRGNLVLLGNRSTDKTIGALYDRYYTLLDLRYPGPEGHIVRTLHSPFGDGRNVIFVGGSDLVGVNSATDVLIDMLGKAGAKPGELAVGRLAEIKLGRGIIIPKDIREFETWEASRGYGSVGYFGWNSISKRMAMYYMTGDPFHAREAIRLAFPDDKAKKEIAEIDGERIENKDAPLSGPYHYNAHMMILFWDLIEESPVFTDAERLRVTNAFSKQLDHRKNEGIYTLRKPPRHVGSRHGQWSAISTYCLGRYFQKDYPNPIWKQCIEGGKLHFRSLHKHAWVSGENDNLFWYNTAIAPILTYLTLTGDRVPIENGVVATLLRGQEILATGRQPDVALNFASMGFLHKAAYLTRDGRWLTYRDRTGVETKIFRLGQSYWPEPNLVPTQPEDLVGKWSVNPLPEPMWEWRNNGFEQAESFLFGSYRGTTDAAGDFILIDGFNGASRNPYHTFAILELRIAGHTLLRGYGNQVITRADGMVEPRIAMNAALKDRGVIGQTAYAVAEVPDAAYCNWRRTLIQRIGRYAIVIDDLTFRADAENMQVEILWEIEGTPRAFEDGHIEFSAPIQVPENRIVPGGQIRCCDVMRTRRNGKVVTMEWVGPVRKGQHKTFITLVGMHADPDKLPMGCYRLAAGVAVLALPAPAMAGIGLGGLGVNNFILMSENHYFARRINQVLLPVPGRRERGKLESISSAQPIGVDWDLVSGELHIVATKETRLTLSLADRGAVRMNGKPVPEKQLLDHMILPAGKHVFTNARPDIPNLDRMGTFLSEQLALIRKDRDRKVAQGKTAKGPNLRSLTTVLTTDVGGEVIDLTTVPWATDDDKPTRLICAATGKTVHVLTPDGKELRRLQTDGTIRMIRWWREHNLLLAGCADEKVIAFDQAGKRKWEFTSVMHPDVFRAAKTYWFKSHPGLEGVHGLYTGVFIDGKSQAFVGSACTLEILDENGKLIKRLPQFWGIPSHFVITAGPGGSLNLLAARRWNGTNQVRVINSKKLEPGRRGFYGVPAGATHVPGWSSMNRFHMFYEDLDGDGTKEVVSEINGTWNRVTVWTKEGKALYDASFGPGRRISLKSCPKNIRDLDVADLDINTKTGVIGVAGKKEILVATSSGLIVCLDHQCKKRWATRLASPPTVMKCITQRVDLTKLRYDIRSDTPPGSTSRALPDRHWIIVGCLDGSVLALDSRGRPSRAGKVDGRPTCIDEITVDGKSMILIATDKGQIKAFTLSP